MRHVTRPLVQCARRRAPDDEPWSVELPHGWPGPRVRYYATHADALAAAHEHVRARARQACRMCGRPFSPTHDVNAPGPTVRHPFMPEQLTRQLDEEARREPTVGELGLCGHSDDDALSPDAARWTPPSPVENPGTIRAARLTPLGIDGQPIGSGRWYDLTGATLDVRPDPADQLVRDCEARGRAMWGEAARRFQW